MFSATLSGGLIFFRRPASRQIIESVLMVGGILLARSLLLGAYFLSHAILDEFLRVQYRLLHPDVSR